MYIVSTYLVKISVGENFCQRLFTIAKISVGISLVTEIFATEFFAFIFQFHFMCYPPFIRLRIGDMDRWITDEARPGCRELTWLVRILIRGSLYLLSVY